jgi:DNA-binding CsgD family transcriptional regulator
LKEITMCSPIPAISAREREVLEAMLKGYRSREIAEALKISLKTVE